MRIKLLFSVMLLLFLTQTMFALNVTTEVIELSKIADEPAFFNFTIINNQNFNFYNVTPINDIIHFDKFNIAPGETKNIQAHILNDENFEGSIILKGFYESNVGQTNENHNVDIDYYDGISMCNFNVVDGDSISFYNNVNDEILLYNADNSQLITTIEKDGVYNYSITNSNDISYYASRRGYIFTNVCNIHVLGTSGLINNPEYDAKLNVNIQTSYPETLVEVPYFESDYEIQVAQTDSNVLTIKNIGLNAAKGVTLHGDWLQFNTNNFDIEAGKTKVVSFVISPLIYNTNETNNTYLKNLTISGNFPDIQKTLNIFIPYQVVNEELANMSVNEDLIVYLISSYCDKNPDFQYCGGTNVVYVNGSEHFTANFSKQQIDEIWDFLFKEYDEDAVYKAAMREIFVDIESKVANESSRNSNIATSINEIRMQLDESNKHRFYLFIIMLLIAVILIVLYIILNYGKIKMLKTKFKFHKGEQL